MYTARVLEIDQPAVILEFIDGRFGLFSNLFHKPRLPREDTVGRRRPCLARLSNLFEKSIQWSLVRRGRRPERSDSCRLQIVIAGNLALREWVDSSMGSAVVSDDQNRDQGSQEEERQSCC